MVHPGPAIRVPEADLAELRARLVRTRWAKRWPIDGWDAGTDQGELRRLVEYWSSGYDWRAHEVGINALPWYVADIGGTGVHFIKFEGERRSMPLLLTNGWPSSFLELVELGRRLATPSQYGGSSEDAFTVVIPSLPGFPFSPQRTSLLGGLPTHEIWHRLMQDELGVHRYGAHGGDLGAGITSRLAQAHPEAVTGIHLMAVEDPVAVDPATITPEEQEYLDALAAWRADGGAYQHQQRTRPLTLAPALSDSPAGLLAWIVEKYRAWSDCDGDLSRRFTDDFVLTQASLYWFTNTISTSLRPYYEQARNAVEVKQVAVPTAVAVFPADLVQPPRSWAERSYHVARYTRMPRGGHFAPHEEPDLLSQDLREFFRPLRES